MVLGYNLQTERGENMDLIVTAINQEDENRSFQAVVCVPETPPNLCRAVLERNDDATLLVDARHKSHSLDILEVWIDTKPEALYFHLSRPSST